ncbi:MAG: hypothetical protein ACYCVD_04210 [Desulfitobacteriaceae bacterium]
MNLQTDPFRAICEALAPILQVQIPTLKRAQIGWPDGKFLQVDGNLPAVFFWEVSDTEKTVVSRLDVHKSTSIANGSGYVYTEQGRVTYLLQISLFANTPEDRSSTGWTIMQYLITNYRFTLADGETATFKYKGKHDSEGETNYYQRDMTFEVITRVLDVTAAQKVATIIKTTTLP